MQEAWHDVLRAGIDLDCVLHLLQGRLRRRSVLLASARGEHGEPNRAKEGAEGKVLVFDGTAKDNAAIA